jgi:hypothetical protein
MTETTTKCYQVMSKGPHPDMGCTGHKTIDM